MRKRAPRRRRAVKRDSTGGMRKVYKYKFKLNPQVLAASTTTALQAGFVAAPAGIVPLTNSFFALGLGTNGFVNYIDCSMSCSNQLTDITNIAPFTSLYDQYKITKVHCQVEYLANTAAVNGQGLMPTVYYWVDRDDSVVPGGLAQILGKQGIKKWHPTSSSSSKTISYTPCQRIGVSNQNPGGVFTPAAELNKPCWLDSTQGTVPGFGLKMVICDFYAPGSVTTTNAFRFNWTYEIAFRSPIQCT